jgi:hypothetical protein
VCLAATCAAATTEPATRPASIEEVVHFPTISLKTKGLMPADAFSLLAQATGVQIAPAQEISQGADGAARKIDLWHDSLYSKIEFDVESANFWQAMDRLTDQAHLTADGADGSLTLSPDFAGRDSSLDSISDTPLCRARATLQPAIHPEARSNNQPPAATDRRAGMSIIFQLDPRVRISAALPPVVETARDQNDREVQIVVPTAPVIMPGGATVLVAIDVAQKAWRLSTLRGYLPVTLAASRVLELPMGLGTKVIAGPWTVELVDIQTQLTGGNPPMGAELDTEIDVGIEPNDSTSPPVPTNLSGLVRVCDASGAALTLRRTNYGPRTTITGGTRQRFSFSRAQPAKILIDIPQESKKVAVPFGFKDVQLP